MIKGCKKKIIYLKNTDSDMFDEAYFVLRCESEGSRFADCDMVEEARRIAEGASLEKRVEKSKKGLWFFSLGAVSATAILALAGIIIAFL